MALNRTAAVQYAKRHALSANPSFKRYGNDCTNFISQCMQAGGWSQITGWYQSNSVWWYTGGIFGVRAASYTWAGAQNFFNFATSSGRARVMPDASTLQLGDVIHLKDSTIYHSMIITGFNGTDPLLSYHTRDTLDKSLATILAGLPTGQSAVYLKMS